MKRNDCAIVKDLIPNYIENQISDETKEFVEAHINNCKNCKEILDVFSNENEEEPKEKEIDFLKRYNTKMNILKLIATLLSTIILITWVILAINYVKQRHAYEKAVYIYEIMDKTYKNIEEIRNSNNFTTTESHFSKGKECVKEVVQYKDRYFKETHSNIIQYENWPEDLGYINYGVVIKDDNVALYAQYSISGSTWNTSCGTVFNKELHKLPGLKNDILEYTNYEVKDDYYEGREYYVISYPKENGEKAELWIDKKDMLLFRYIYGLDEMIGIEYSWQINNVTDEDIKIQDENINREFQERIRRFI